MRLSAYISRSFHDWPFVHRVLGTILPSKNQTHRTRKNENSSKLEVDIRRNSSNTKLPNDTNTTSDKNNNNNNTDNKSSICDGPKTPPTNSEKTEKAFEQPKDVPTEVFRDLGAGEVLGPNAHKNEQYKNPEYYAYHKYSSVDLFKSSMNIRDKKTTEITDSGDNSGVKDQNGEMIKNVSSDNSKCEKTDQTAENLKSSVKKDQPCGKQGLSGVSGNNVPSTKEVSGKCEKTIPKSTPTFFEKSKFISGTPQKFTSLETAKKFDKISKVNNLSIQKQVTDQIQKNKIAADKEIKLISEEIEKIMKKDTMENQNDKQENKQNTNLPNQSEDLMVQSKTEKALINQSKLNAEALEKQKLIAIKEQVAAYCAAKVQTTNKISCSGSTNDTKEPPKWKESGKLPTVKDTCETAKEHQVSKLISKILRSFQEKNKSACDKSKDKAEPVKCDQKLEATNLTGTDKKYNETVHNCKLQQDKKCNTDTKPAVQENKCPAKLKIPKPKPCKTGKKKGKQAEAEAPDSTELTTTCNNVKKVQPTPDTKGGEEKPRPKPFVPPCSNPLNQIEKPKPTPPCSAPKVEEKAKCTAKKEEPPKCAAKKEEPPKCPAKKEEPPKCAKKEEPPKCTAKKEEPPKCTLKKEEPPKCTLKKEEPPKCTLKKEEPPKCPVKKEEPPKCTAKKEEPPKCTLKKEEPPKCALKKEEPPKCPAKKEEPPKCAKKEEPPKCTAKKEEPPKCTLKKEEPPKCTAKKEEAPKCPAKKEEAPKCTAKKEEAPKCAAKKEEPAKCSAKKEENPPCKIAPKKTAEKQIQSLKTEEKYKKIVESRPAPCPTPRKETTVQCPKPESKCKDEEKPKCPSNPEGNASSSKPKKKKSKSKKKTGKKGKKKPKSDSEGCAENQSNNKAEQKSKCTICEKIGKLTTKTTDCTDNSKNVVKPEQTKCVMPANKTLKSDEKTTDPKVSNLFNASKCKLEKKPYEKISFVKVTSMPGFPKMPRKSQKNCDQSSSETYEGNISKLAIITANSWQSNDNEDNLNNKTIDENPQNKNSINKSREDDILHKSTNKSVLNRKPYTGEKQSKAPCDKSVSKNTETLNTKTLVQKSTNKELEYNSSKYSAIPNKQIPEQTKSPAKKAADVTKYQQFEKLADNRKVQNTSHQTKQSIEQTNSLVPSSQSQRLADSVISSHICSQPQKPPGASKATVTFTQPKKIQEQSKCSISLTSSQKAIEPPKSQQPPNNNHTQKVSNSSTGNQPKQHPDQSKSSKNPTSSTDQGASMQPFKISEKSKINSTSAYSQPKQSQVESKSLQSSTPCKGSQKISQPPVSQGPQKVPETTPKNTGASNQAKCSKSPSPSNTPDTTKCQQPRQLSLTDADNIKSTSPYYQSKKTPEQMNKGSKYPALSNSTQITSESTKLTRQRTLKNLSSESPKVSSSEQLKSTPQKKPEPPKCQGSSQPSRKGPKTQLSPYSQPLQNNETSKSIHVNSTSVVRKSKNLPEQNQLALSEFNRVSIKMEISTIPIESVDLGHPRDTDNVSIDVLCKDNSPEKHLQNKYYTANILGKPKLSHNVNNKQPAEQPFTDDNNNIKSRTKSCPVLSKHTQLQQTKSIQSETVLESKTGTTMKSKSDTTNNQTSKPSKSNVKSDSKATDSSAITTKTDMSCKKISDKELKIFLDSSENHRDNPKNKNMKNVKPKPKSKACKTHVLDITIQTNDPKKSPNNFNAKDNGIQDIKKEEVGGITKIKNIINNTTDDRPSGSNNFKRYKKSPYSKYQPKNWSDSFDQQSTNSLENFSENFENKYKDRITVSEDTFEPKITCRKHTNSVESHRSMNSAADSNDNLKATIAVYVHEPKILEKVIEKTPNVYSGNRDSKNPSNIIATPKAVVTNPPATDKHANSTDPQKTEATPKYVQNLNQPKQFMENAKDANKKLESTTIIPKNPVAPNISANDAVEKSKINEKTTSVLTDSKPYKIIPPTTHFDPNILKQEPQKLENKIIDKPERESSKFKEIDKRHSLVDKIIEKVMESENSVELKHSKAMKNIPGRTTVKKPEGIGTMAEELKKLDKEIGTYQKSASERNFQKRLNVSLEDMAEIVPRIIETDVYPVDSKGNQIIPDSLNKSLKVGADDLSKSPKPRKHEKKTVTYSEKVPPVLSGTQNQLNNNLSSEKPAAEKLPSTNEKSLVPTTPNSKDTTNPNDITTKHRFFGNHFISPENISGKSKIFERKEHPIDLSNKINFPNSFPTNQYPKSPVDTKNMFGKSLLTTGNASKSKPPKYVKNPIAFEPTSTLAPDDVKSSIKFNQPKHIEMTVDEDYPINIKSLQIDPDIIQMKNQPDSLIKKSNRNKISAKNLPSISETTKPEDVPATNSDGKACSKSNEKQSSAGEDAGGSKGDSAGDKDKGDKKDNDKSKPPITPNGFWGKPGACSAGKKTIPDEP